MLLDPHQVQAPLQTPEKEEVGEELAHTQHWVVVAAAAVGAALADPQFQEAEEVVVQNVQWLGVVVAEGPLGLEVGVPVVSVAVGHLPKVQGAVGQNDPC